MAAAMHFFSRSTLKGTQSTNALPSMVGETPHEKWSVLKAILTRLVCRCVLVDSIASDLNTPQDSQQPALSNMVNPHTVRIAEKHNYAMTHQARIAVEHCYASATSDKQQRKRCLPLWMRKVLMKILPLMKCRGGIILPASFRKQIIVKKLTRPCQLN